MTVPRGPDKLDTNARVEVRANGAVVGTRRIIDLIGSGLTITGVDDKGVDDKVTLTLTVASGSATPSGAAGGALDGTYPNPGLASSVAGAGLAETSDVLSVNVGTGLSIVSDAVAITDTGISAGTYGGPATDLTLTLNAQGQVTAAINSPRSGSGGSGGGALTNSWLNANAVQYVFVDHTQKVPSWTLLDSNGTDLAIDGGDPTLINILTDGYYQINYSARIYQTAVTSTTVAVLSTGAGATVASATSVAYQGAGLAAFPVPAGFPQNVALWGGHSFGPFKAAAGDTIGAVMQLVIGTVGDDFTYDANLSVIRLA